MKRFIVLFVVNIEIYIHFFKNIVLSIICSKCKNENKKIFKKEESVTMLKFIDLIIEIEHSQKYM